MVIGKVRIMVWMRIRELGDWWDKSASHFHYRSSRNFLALPTNRSIIWNDTRSESENLDLFLVPCKFLRIRNFHVVDNVAIGLVGLRTNQD